MNLISFFFNGLFSINWQYSTWSIQECAYIYIHSVLPHKMGNMCLPTHYSTLALWGHFFALSGWLRPFLFNQVYVCYLHLWWQSPRTGCEIGKQREFTEEHGLSTCFCLKQVDLEGVFWASVSADLSWNNLPSCSSSDAESRGSCLTAVHDCTHLSTASKIQMQNAALGNTVWVSDTPRRTQGP